MKKYIALALALMIAPAFAEGVDAPKTDQPERKAGMSKRHDGEGKKVRGEKGDKKEWKGEKETRGEGKRGEGRRNKGPKAPKPDQAAPAEEGNVTGGSMVS